MRCSASGATRPSPRTERSGCCSRPYPSLPARPAAVPRSPRAGPGGGSSGVPRRSGPTGVAPLAPPGLPGRPGYPEAGETPGNSDHRCFGRGDERHRQDLLPIPFTRAMIPRVVDRVRRIEDALGLPFAVENVSWYAHPGEAEMTEAQFITEVLSRCDAGLLLDVNNAYVNARNHGGDARDFIAAMPAERVVQIHVAGHLTLADGMRLDTHGEAVCDDVYELLRVALARTGPVPVLLERDQNFPAFDDLCAELRRLDAIYREATA